MKREQGQNVQGYFAWKDSSTNKVLLLEAQSNMTENFVNNVSEVSGVKQEGVTSEDNVAYTEYEDGTRDINWSVTTARKEGAISEVQAKLIKDLKTKVSTEIYWLVGDTEPAVTPADRMTMPFTGTAYKVLISGITNNYPYGSPITSTINIQHKGSDKPVDFVDEALSDVATSLLGA